MKSFRCYQNCRVPTLEGLPASGDYTFGNVTFRFTNGYLNDCCDEDKTVFPAVETTDGRHIEHWKNGVLHCDTGPAVKDLDEGVSEWFIEGKNVVPGENNGQIADPRNSVKRV